MSTYMTVSIVSNRPKTTTSPWSILVLIYHNHGEPERIVDQIIIQQSWFQAQAGGKKREKNQGSHRKGNVNRGQPQTRTHQAKPTNRTSLRNFNKSGTQRQR